MGKIILITEEELEKKIGEAMQKYLAPVISLLHDKAPKEEPKKRSEIMAELQIKDVRTFKKRAQDCNAKSCGSIGREPAYYLKHFQKAG